MTMDVDEGWRPGMMIKDDDNISWQGRMTMNDNEGWQQGIMTRKGDNNDDGEYGQGMTTMGDH